MTGGNQHEYATCTWAMFIVGLFYMGFCSFAVFMSVFLKSFLTLISVFFIFLPGNQVDLSQGRVPSPPTNHGQLPSLLTVCNSSYLGSCDNPTLHFEIQLTVFTLLS